MKIHQVIAAQEPHYSVDPIKGVTLSHKTVLKPGTASVIGGPDGEYEIQEDGSFEVPDELGAALIAQPDWFEGSNVFQTAGAIPLDDADAEQLREQVADLTERLAALEKPKRAAHKS